MENTAEQPPQEEKITHAQIAEAAGKEEQKKVTKKEFEVKTLRYDFNAEETHDLALELARTNQKKVSIENEKKSVMSGYAAKINECIATVNKLSGQVNDGHEMREVRCEVIMNHPENGKKTYIRGDNNMAFIEKMTQFDHNLFNQAQDKLAGVEDSDWLNEEKSKLRGGLAEGYVKGRQSTDLLNQVENGGEKPSKSTASNTRKGNSKKKKVAQSADAPSGEIEEQQEDNGTFPDDLDI